MGLVASCFLSVVGDCHLPLPAQLREVLGLDFSLDWW